jgi:uncharacterized membrane protein YebE (DUF533 family)
MGLFNFKKKRALKTHIKSLLALAAADGYADTKELLLIATVAAREGMKSSELEEILRSGGNYKFTVPENDEKKLQYLKDMVSLMLVDGDIDDNEMAICKIVAQEFGYIPQVIDAVLIDIIVDLKKKSK